MHQNREEVTATMHQWFQLHNFDFHKIDLILNKIFSYNVKPPRLAKGNIHIAEAAGISPHSDYVQMLDLGIIQ